MELNKRRIFLIASIFFIALLPFAATLIQNYVDEWHYINGVFGMLNTGDYLTPYEDRYEIAFRFNKPILTYWTILASFKLFGIHVFSLRIGFLLAATLTLILTALIAQNAFRKTGVTEFAILILITQGNFLAASMRAIPDILLTLFLTLSGYGASCLLTSSRHKRLGWWCFYLGAALAFETKGLLSVLFVIYTLIFLKVVEPQIFKNHRLIQLSAGITGFIVAFSWLVAVWILRGNIVLHSFLFDQIGRHVPSSLMLPLVRIQIPEVIMPFLKIPGMILWVLAVLFPWSLFSLWGFFKERWLKTMERSDLRIYQFIIGWALVWAIVLGLGSHISVRYMVPLMPLFAILMADSLSRFAVTKQQRLGEYLFYILIPVLIVEGLAGFSIIGQLAGLVKSISYLLIFVSLAVGLVFVLRQQRMSDLIISAWMMFFAVAAVSYPLSILVLPEETEQIVKRMTEEFPQVKLQPNLMNKYRLAAKIRLLSKGQIDPVVSKKPVSYPVLVDNDIMQQKHFLFPDRTKLLLAYSLEDVSPMDFVLGTVTWTLPEKIKQHRKEYWGIK